MASRLTEKTINAAVVRISSAAKPQSLPAGDVNGLALVLRPSGSHSWRLVYRPAGSKHDTPARTVTLGKFPAISLEDARRQGRALIGKIAVGEDPAATKRHKRVDDRPTVAKALDLYEAHLTRRKIVNTKTTLSALWRGLKPFLADDVGTLSRKGIVRQINLLADANKAGAAADLRKHARSFCEWSVNEGYASHNVMAGLKMPRLSRHEKLEQEGANLRALTDEELRAVWAAAKTLNRFGALVMLGLSTGLRRGELAHLRWSDVKADRIVIPAVNTKTGAKHEVPMTALSALVLAQVPPTVGPLVFPSGRRVGGETPLSGWTQMVARLAKHSSVPDLRLHALRRTFRSKLTEAGVPEHVAELVIGHQRQGLVKLYDHSTLWAERVDAAEKACRRIADVVGQKLDSVRPLRAALKR